MTEVIATCNVCGDVRLQADAFNIVLRNEGEFYRFLCNECDTYTERKSNDKITVVLVAIGVPQVNLTTITEDEIKEFTRQIQKL